MLRVLSPVCLSLVIVAFTHAHTHVTRDHTQDGARFDSEEDPDPLTPARSHEEEANSLFTLPSKVHVWPELPTPSPHHLLLHKSGLKRHRHRIRHNRRRRGRERSSGLRFVSLKKERGSLLPRRQDRISALLQGVESASLVFSEYDGSSSVRRTGGGVNELGGSHSRTDSVAYQELKTYQPVVAREVRKSVGVNPNTSSTSSLSSSSSSTSPASSLSSPPPFSSSASLSSSSSSSSSSLSSSSPSSSSSSSSTSSVGPDHRHPSITQINSSATNFLWNVQRDEEERPENVAGAVNEEEEGKDKKKAQEKETEDGGGEEKLEAASGDGGLGPPSPPPPEEGDFAAKSNLPNSLEEPGLHRVDERPSPGGGGKLWKRTRAGVYSAENSIDFILKEEEGAGENRKETRDKETQETRASVSLGASSHPKRLPGTRETDGDRPPKTIGSPSHKNQLVFSSTTPAGAAAPRDTLTTPLPTPATTRKAFSIPGNTANDLPESRSVLLDDLVLQAPKTLPAPPSDSSADALGAEEAKSHEKRKDPTADSSGRQQPLGTPRQRGNGVFFSIPSSGNTSRSPKGVPAPPPPPHIPSRNVPTAPYSLPDSASFMKSPEGSASRTRTPTPWSATGGPPSSLFSPHSANSLLSPPNATSPTGAHSATPPLSPQSLTSPLDPWPARDPAAAAPAPLSAMPSRGSTSPSTLAGQRELNDTCYSVDDVLLVVLLTSVVNLAAFIVVTMLLCLCSFRKRGGLCSLRYHDNEETNDDVGTSVGCLEACLPDISYQRHVARGSGRSKGSGARTLRLHSAMQDLFHSTTNRTLSKPRQLYSKRRSQSLEDLTLS